MKVEFSIECDTPEDFLKIIRQIGRSPKLQTTRLLKSMDDTLRSIDGHAMNTDNAIEQIRKNQPKIGGPGYDPAMRSTL